MTPPGLMAVYNHDLDPGAEFVAHFPRIGKLLSGEATLELFRRYDEEARRFKHRFNLFGVSSLVLGTLALLGVSTELVAHALGHSVPTWTTALIELGALSAIVILVCARLGRYRVRWRVACFVRERIRQWHFQQFLDGALIELLVRDRPRGEQALRSRWGAFQETVRSGAGALEDYVRQAAAPSRLLHEDTTYQDDAVMDEVWKALGTLRFDHQAQFARAKTAEIDGAQVVPLREQTHWAETVATVALLLAVAIPAVQLTILAAGEPPASPHAAFDLRVVLFGGALAMTVLSAGARAYRTGLSLPEELDSYEEYAARVSELRELFLATQATSEERRRILKELEVEAARELQRFLRLKSKATFIA